jgi:hypothetical protein
MNDLGGSDRAQIEVLSQNLSGGTEWNHENLRLAEIGTNYLPNRSQKHYLHANPFGVAFIDPHNDLEGSTQDGIFIDQLREYQLLQIVSWVELNFTLPQQTIHVASVKCRSVYICGTQFC